MEFIRLKPEHFGKLQKREIVLQPGINVIYGKNESGKTTLHAFLRGMLFGIERARGRAAKEDPYVRYQPWETPGAYQGSMEFSQDGVIYHVSRSFYLKERSLTVTRQDTGRAVEVPDGQVAALIPHLTGTNFKNTVSVEQRRARTDTELAQEVQNYIANLSTAKSNEVDVSHAMEQLAGKKKRLASEELSSRVEELCSAVEEGRGSLERMDELGQRQKKLKQQSERLKKQKEQLLKEERDCLRGLEAIAVLEKEFAGYETLQRRAAELQEKQKLVRSRLSDMDGGRERLRWLQQGVEETEKVFLRRQELSSRMEQLAERQKTALETVEAEKKRYSRFSVCAAVLGGLLFAAGLWRMADGVTAVILLLTAGLSIFTAVGARFLLFYKKPEWTRRTERITSEQRELEEEVIRADRESLKILMERGVKETEQLRLRCAEQMEINAQAAYWKEQQEQLKRDLADVNWKEQEEKRTLQALSEQFSEQLPEGIRNGFGEGWKTDFCAWLSKEIPQRQQRQTEIGSWLDQLERQEQETALQLERMEWELSSYEQVEAELTDQETELERSSQLLADKEKELAAINLAAETLKGLSAEIHDSFGWQLNRMLSHLAAQITDGAYTEVTVNEKMEVKVLHDSEYVPLEKLSAGTIDQIYLALRLSVAQLFFGGEPMPVLLDDALVFYDDERARAVLRVLAQGGRQVLLFTCQHREEQLLEQEQIPFHLIRLS